MLLIKLQLAFEVLNNFSKYEKIIAYNEVGRAIVCAVRNGIESVDKITIYLDQDL